MRRGVMLAGIVLLAALGLAAPARAITYGTPTATAIRRSVPCWHRWPIRTAPGRPARER
jgi:hypothetical protein